MTKKIKNKKNCELIILNFIFATLEILIIYYLFFLFDIPLNSLLKALILIGIIAVVLSAVFDETPYKINKKTKRRK